MDSHSAADLLRDRRKARALMLAYLKLRLRMDDMHGVQDAASDIREIDAEIRLLENAAK